MLNSLQNSNSYKILCKMCYTKCNTRIRSFGGWGWGLDYGIFMRY